MAGDSKSTVKSMIDEVKFDGKNNFDMWRCEVTDALMTSNIEDTLQLEKKLETTSEED